MPKEPKQPNKAWKVSSDWKDVWESFQSRKIELLDSRKNIHGTSIDQLIIDAQAAYVPRKRPVKSPRKAIIEPEGHLVANKISPLKIAMGDNTCLILGESIQPVCAMLLKTAFATSCSCKR